MWYVPGAASTSRCRMMGNLACKAQLRLEPEKQAVGTLGVVSGAEAVIVAHGALVTMRQPHTSHDARQSTSG